MTDEKEVHQGFTFTVTLLAVVLLITFSSQLPEGVAPQWLRVGNAINRALWPQGWYFFAHTPEDNVRVFYSVGSDDGLGDLMTKPQLAPERLWGIRRTGSAQIVETNVIFDQIPTGLWTSCSGLSTDQCWLRVRQRPSYNAVNRAAVPQFCGPLMAAVEGPASWSKTDDGAIPRRPLLQAVMVELACPR